MIINYKLFNILMKNYSNLIPFIHLNNLLVSERLNLY